MFGLAQMRPRTTGSVPLMLEGSNEERAAWIAAFTSYVARLRPQASPVLIARAASELHHRLGQFHPVDVAEAEWNDMPLEQPTGEARAD